MRTIYATLVLAVLFALPYAYVWYEIGPPASSYATGRVIGRYLFPFIGGAVIAGVIALFSKSARSRPNFLLRFNWAALVLWVVSLLGTLSRVAQG